MFILSLIGTVLILGICVTLVLDPKYDDGLLGKVALSSMALASYGSMALILEYGVDFNNAPFILLVFGLLGFLTNHCFLFYKNRNNVNYKWIKPYGRSSPPNPS